MKKFSKLASAVLLTLQAFLATPFHVLADETFENEPTEQVQQTVETTETTDYSTTISSSESSTISSSESSTTLSSESSTTSSSSNTTSSSEVTTPSQTEPPKTEEPKHEEQTQAPAASQVQPAQTPPAQVSQAVETPQAPINQLATTDLSQLVPSSTITTDGTIQFDRNETVESFITKIGEPARKIGQEHDLYASVMIAQAILESASGQSQLAQAPNYNLFGIKGSHNGKSVSMATEEDLGNGTMYATQAGFRVYENYEDCFNDYATLLKEGLTGDKDFYAGVWKSNAKTYQEATKFLTGRYATDTQYHLKLNGLIETYNLTEYDKEIQGPQMNKKGYQVPINSYTISSPFGNRGGEFHRGLDMAAAQGEPIHATKAGKVIKAELHYSWGNYVVIQHEDGSTALYAHQQQYLVKAGDNVSQGQVIGYVGSTGNSTGSHLHLELCQDDSLSQDKLVDPQSVLFGD